MARYEDEFATRFTAEGQNSVTGAMDKMGAAGGKLGSLGPQMATAFAFLGPRISAAGEKLDEFSKGNAELFKHAEHVQHELEKMWETKGYSAESLKSVEELAGKMQDQAGISDELTKHTASLMSSFDMKPGEIMKLMPYLAAQADLFGADMGQVGSAIGKAFSTGNYGVLRRYGVTLSDAQMATLKQAEALQASGSASDVAAGKALALDTIFKALSENTPDLYARLETARGRSERLANTIEDVREQMGAGVVEMRGYGTGLLYNLVRPLSQGHTELLKTAGAAGFLTAKVVKGAGAVGSFMHDWVGFAASLKIARSGKEALKVATVAETAAEAKKIGVAGKEAAALANTGKQVSQNIGLLGKLGLATSGGMGWGMQGIMGGFTTLGGAGSGMSAASVLTGGAGLTAALASGVIVAAAAAVAAVLIARDVKVIQETQKELANVDKGNAGLQQQWQAGQQAGLTGQVQETKRHTYWQNLWASMHSDWSEEDATSIRTTPGGRNATRTTPTGNLQVTIPGDQVVTTQAARDHKKLR